MNFVEVLVSDILNYLFGHPRYGLVVRTSWEYWDMRDVRFYRTKFMRAWDCKLINTYPGMSFTGAIMQAEYLDE